MNKTTEDLGREAFEETAFEITNATEHESCAAEYQAYVDDGLIEDPGPTDYDFFRRGWLAAFHKEKGERQ